MIYDLLLLFFYLMAFYFMTSTHGGIASSHQTAYIIRVQHNIRFMFAFNTDGGL